jgi:hypothetical protein
MQDPNTRKPLFKNGWGSEFFHMVPEYSVVFKSLKGYVGIVPILTQPNCQIFMFEGSDLPFVLWPVENMPRHFRFVGICYV